MVLEGLGMFGAWLVFLWVTGSPLLPFVMFLPAQIVALALICVVSLLDGFDRLLGRPFRKAYAALKLVLRLAPLVGLELLLSLGNRRVRQEQPPNGFGPRAGGASPPPPPPPPPPDPHGQAVALLALPPGFTQANLKAAYRTAIRRAHPDAGGTQEAAQAVIAAHALIRSRNGWDKGRGTA